MLAPKRAPAIVIALPVLFLLGLASHSAAATETNVESQALQQLRSRNPAAADTLERANDARRAGDHRRAAALYRSVTQAAPGFSYAWRREGYELLALDLRPDAIECMRTAARLERSAWNLLGLAYTLSAETKPQPPTERDIDEAVSVLREAESITESPEIARLGCLLALRKHDASWLRLEAGRFLRVDPSNPWAHSFEAIALAMSGDRSGSRAALSRARSLGLPDSEYQYFKSKLGGAPSPAREGAAGGSMRWAWIAGALVLLVLGSIVHLRRAPDIATEKPAAEAYSAGPFRAARPALHPWALGLLTVLVLLPFSGKAFHIDDPLFVWAAKRIQAAPQDPYGFSVNWYGRTMPMSEVTKNPPLTSYLITAVGAVTGIREQPLHIAFLVPAVLVILGTYWLAARWSRRPWLAALCVLFTPVFLVSSGDVMSDTLMLAFWMMAVVAWVSGLERGSWPLLLLSSVCVAAGALSKYFAAALIPLLFVYSVAVRRRLAKETAWLIVPVAILAAYQWVTGMLYGHGLLTDAASYAASVSAQSAPERLLIAASFTGGCLGLAWLLALWPWKRRAALLISGIGVLAFATSAALRGLVGHAIGGSGGNPWVISAHLGLFVAGGAAALLLAGRALVSEKDGASLLLALWALGTFAFAAFVNWSTNGRSILPMIPPMAILIARRIDRAPSAPLRAHLLAIGGAAALLAIGVAQADLLQADAGRRASDEIHRRFGRMPGRHWFSGHWGFQYYMQAYGWEPIDRDALALSPGDLLAVPTYNTNVIRLDARMSRSLDSLDVPSGRWIATTRGDMGAGFYSDVFGPLPFAFGKVRAEPYFVQEVVLPR